MIIPRYWINLGRVVTFYHPRATGFLNRYSMRSFTLLWCCYTLSHGCTRTHPRGGRGLNPFPFFKLLQTDHRLVDFGGRILSYKTASWECWPTSFQSPWKAKVQRTQHRTMKSLKEMETTGQIQSCYPNVLGYYIIPYNLNILKHSQPDDDLAHPRQAPPSQLPSKAAGT